MNGAIPVFPPYVFMVWAGTALPLCLIEFIIFLKNKKITKVVHPTKQAPDMKHASTHEQQLDLV